MRGIKNMSYIEFKEICKVYKMGEVEINALSNTSFNIEKGELVCILGPSGAGKTTALNILGGMDDATKRFF
jgi:putative ABC transport system ATP-binding protein